MDLLLLFADETTSTSVAVVGGIYAAVVTPWIASLQGESKRLKKEVTDCHSEREKERIFRVRLEEQVKYLAKETGVTLPSDKSELDEKSTR